MCAIMLGGLCLGFPVSVIVVSWLVARARPMPAWMEGLEDELDRRGEHERGP